MPELRTTITKRVEFARGSVERSTGEADHNLNLVPGGAGTQAYVASFRSRFTTHELIDLRDAINLYLSEVEIDDISPKG